mmetsp:Transcript_2185/g.4997  ORF Transcript_2185/g.4997 Transcript_2185/m.4997 type:complete len:227 (+) Transcript_2185:560-1240(+)
MEQEELIHIPLEGSQQIPAFHTLQRLCRGSVVELCARCLGRDVVPRPHVMLPQLRVAVLLHLDDLQPRRLATTSAVPCRNGLPGAVQQLLHQLHLLVRDTGELRLAEFRLDLPPRWQHDLRLLCLGHVFVDSELVLGVAEGTHELDLPQSCWPHRHYFPARSATPDLDRGEARLLRGSELVRGIALWTRKLNETRPLWLHKANETATPALYLVRASGWGWWGCGAR